MRIIARLCIPALLALAALGSWNNALTPDAQRDALRAAIADLSAGVAPAEELRLAALLADAGERVDWLLERAEAPGRAANQRSELLDATEKLLARFQSGEAGVGNTGGGGNAGAGNTSGGNTSGGNTSGGNTGGGNTGSGGAPVALATLSGAKLAAALQTAQAADFNALTDEQKFALYARGAPASKLGLPREAPTDWSGLREWWHAPAIVVSELAEKPDAAPSMLRLVQLDDGLRKIESTRASDPSFARHFSYPAFVVARALLDRGLGVDGDNELPSALGTLDLSGAAAALQSADNPRPRWALLARRLSGADPGLAGQWREMVAPVLAVDGDARERWAQVDAWITGGQVPGGNSSPFRDAAPADTSRAVADFERAWSGSDDSAVLAAMQRVKHARARISGRVVESVGTLGQAGTFLGLLRNPSQAKEEPNVHLFVETLYVKGRVFGLVAYSPKNRLIGSTLKVERAEGGDLRAVVQTAMDAIGKEDTRQADLEAKVVIGLDCAPADQISAATDAWLRGVKRDKASATGLVVMTPSIAALQDDGGGWDTEAAMRFYYRSMRGSTRMLGWRTGGRRGVASIGGVGVGKNNAAYVFGFHGGERPQWPNATTIAQLNQRMVGAPITIVPLLLPREQ